MGEFGVEKGEFFAFPENGKKGHNWVTIHDQPIGTENVLVSSITTLYGGEKEDCTTILPFKDIKYLGLTRDSRINYVDIRSYKAGYIRSMINRDGRGLRVKSKSLKDIQEGVLKSPETERWVKRDWEVVKKEWK